MLILSWYETKCRLNCYGGPSCNIPSWIHLPDSPCVLFFIARNLDAKALNIVPIFCYALCGFGVLCEGLCLMLLGLVVLASYLRSIKSSFIAFNFPALHFLLSFFVCRGLCFGSCIPLSTLFYHLTVTKLMFWRFWFCWVLWELNSL